MKNSQESDRLRDALRKKLADDPNLSEKDAELWGKIKAEIESSEAKTYKLNHLWLVMTAAFLLSLSVSLTFFLFDSPAKTVFSEDLKPVFEPAAPAGEERQERKVETDLPSEEHLAENNLPENKTETPTPQKTLPVDWKNAKDIQAEGKVKDHLLTDGSLVSMNTGSVVKVINSFSQQRNLLLEKGEAYFKVHPDKNNPFTVYFSDYKVVVVGTEFNIRNVGNESVKEVTVMEGVVRVYDNLVKEGIELRQGEQLTLVKGKPSLLKKVEAPNFIAWKTGNLDFTKASLEEVATVLSRKYEQDIHLAPELKNCKFTGDLSKMSLDESLEIIRMSTSATIEQNNNQINITGQGCD